MAQYKDLERLFTKSLDYTHVVMGNHKKSVYLSSTHNEPFYQLYKDMVKNMVPLCIAEKPTNYVPLIGDIDIKLNVEDPIYGPNDKLYERKDVYGYIKAFQDVVRDKVDKITDRQLWCIVLEKPINIDRVNGVVKNGFHLHFPHLFLHKDTIKSTIIPMVVVKTQELVGVVDDVSSKCWLMYGSAKDERSIPYKLSYIVDEKLQPIDLKKTFDDDRDDEAITLDLPLLLSINPRGKPYFELKPDFVAETQQALRTINRLNRPTTITEPEQMTSEFVEKIRFLLSLLKPFRSEEYNEWWGVGIILYNINDSDDMLDLWKEFSARSDKYDEAQCDFVWLSFGQKNKPMAPRTIASLYYMAHQDNPSGFKAYKVRYDNVLDVNHMNVEQLIRFVRTIDVPTTDYDLMRMFANTTTVYLSGNLGWFKFNGNIWYKLENVSRLMRHEFATFANDLNSLSKKLSNLSLAVDDDEDDDEEEEREPLQKLIIAKKKDIGRAYCKLKNEGSIKSLISTGDSFFGKDKLDEIMNSNPYLIAFTNGVYDLQMHSFRNGSPDDYLSKSLRIPYNSSFTMDHPKVVDMLRFFEKIFPDDDVREYFMLQVCEVFLGGNHDKVAMIWTGDGNNGKSVTQALFEKMFGELAVKLPKSVVVDYNVKAGACFPELVRVKGGVRWTVIDELSLEETIHAGSLKLLTGNDTLYARDVHQKGEGLKEIDPMFKLVLICNTIPVFKVIDTTAMERVRVIPFETTFVNKAPVDECGTPLTYEQCKDAKLHVKDRNITDKLMDIAEAFAWYLLQRFKEKDDVRQRNGGVYDLTIPDKVQRATLEYTSRCDAIANFVDDMFEKTDNPDDSLYVPLLYNDFKMWYTQNYPVKSANILKREFCKMFLKSCNGDPKTQKVVKLRRKLDDGSSGYGSNNGSIENLQVELV